MILLLQSYQSPYAMSNDGGTYKELVKRFGGELVPVFKKADTVRSYNLKETIQFAWKANKMLKSGDVLFGWGAHVTVFTLLFNTLLGGDVKFLSQNLIVECENRKYSGNLKRWIMSKLMFNLYKWALGRKNFFVTVNSEQLPDYYCKYFYCKKEKFSTVYDAMYLYPQDFDCLKKRKDDRTPYVFFGGKAARDVKTFTEVVKLLPNVRFKAVIPSGMVLPEMKSLKNLEVRSDIPMDDFNRIMCMSSVVCIPLNSMRPCGLSVMQKGILMQLPIVSTETPSMRIIIPDDNYGYLLSMGDAKGLANKVESLLNDKSLSSRICDNALKRFDKLFTPQAVGMQLADVIDKIRK